MYQGMPSILESGEKGTITGCTGELKKSAEGKVWHVQRNAFDFSIGGGGNKQMGPQWILKTYNVKNTKME